MKLFFALVLLTLGFSSFTQASPAATEAAPSTPAAAKVEAPKKTVNQSSNKVKTEKVDLFPQVIMSTSMGDMVLELNQDKAPISVKNFLKYTKKGAYNGKIFHRVIPGFMVQGGGFDVNFERGFTSAPIVNESNNTLKNLRGTISMARTSDPDSATNQFFINLKANPDLDPMYGRPGYAVFGKVISGIQVIDKIAAAPQGAHTGRFVNAPNMPIIINTIKILATKDKVKPSKATK